MLLTVSWLTASLVAPAHGMQPPEGLLPDGIHAPCGTSSTWTEVDPEPLPWTGTTVDKVHRDPFGAPHAVTSEHFAVHFGDHGEVGHDEIDRLLEALEAAWQVHIVELGHTPPAGTDLAYFNVYIGDSDPNLPQAGQVAGYYAADRHGWPMIVIGAHTLDDGDFADITAAHELYHAVQGATRRYDYAPDAHGSWFWEASATWASTQVFPDHDGASAFLAAYAFLPHHRVDAFRRPETGALEEYYPYGAYLFLQHLTETTRSPTLIRDAWEDDGDEASPLEVLRQGLAERGLDFDAVWMRHAARNATWDYAQHSLDIERIRSWEDHFPGMNRELAGWLHAGGQPEWWSPPSELRPRSYGSNVFAMHAPDAGRYTFEVSGQAFGVHSHDARYASILVLDRGGRISYRNLVFEAHHGRLVVDDLHGVDTAYLVVGAWSPERVPLHDDESFPYEIRVGFEPALVDVIPEPLPPGSETSVRAGGCDAAGGSPVWAGWLVLLLGMVGRSRRA